MGPTAPILSELRPGLGRMVLRCPDGFEEVEQHVLLTPCFQVSLCA